MATTHGPLLSLTAAGSIGDVLTYQHRAGGTTTRHKPRSAAAPDTAQLASRQTLRFLSSFFDTMPFPRQNYWAPAPRPANLTSWTNLVKQNNGALIRNHNTQQFRYTPHRPNWPQPAGLTLSITGATLHIDCTQCPTPPGYTFFRAQAIIWDDLDPTAPGSSFPSIRSTFDTQFPMSVGISAGTHAKTKVVAIYGEFRDTHLNRRASSPLNGHIFYP